MSWESVIMCGGDVVGHIYIFLLYLVMFFIHLFIYLFIYLRKRVKLVMVEGGGESFSLLSSTYLYRLEPYRILLIST